MYGEIRDANYPGQPLLYEKCRSDACVIMLTTLGAMGGYYIHRCRRQFCSEKVEGGDNEMHARCPQSIGSALIQEPASSANSAVCDADDADRPADAPVPLDDRVALQSAAAVSVPGGQQRELLPRPFMRSLFPTWRSYEHVHVSPNYIK